MLAMGVGASLAMPAMTHAAIDHTPKERAGIGSAVLNASRQVGGVVGIALLGALIGGHFMVGMHRGMLVAGVLFLIGSGVSFRFVDQGVDGEEDAEAHRRVVDMRGEPRG